MATMNEAEHAAAAQLERLNGRNELTAAILALLLPVGSQRARRAWKNECAGMSRAAELREAVTQLGSTARLPWLEVLVSRMRNQAPADRQALLESTRRVMAARGIMRPIDRLHWLAMRQRMGESAPAAMRPAASAELSQLPQTEVSAIAAYSAFLARMVPAAPANLDDTAPTEAGMAWYANVMAPWEKRVQIPPCEPPDTDGLVHALQQLQSMAWMQRPALLRGWVTAAIRHSSHGRLADGAADALRLSGALLDSPLPPELLSHYGAAAIVSTP